MSYNTYYTVKFVRDLLKDLDEDTPLFGIILTPDDVDFEQRPPTKDEWAEIVALSEDATNFGFESAWTAIRDILSESAIEVRPEPEE